MKKRCHRTKDASIIHLYKRKSDHACCNNHRGISLLSVAGKVLARVLLNRHNMSTNWEYYLRGVDSTPVAAQLI